MAILDHARAIAGDVGGDSSATIALRRRSHCLDADLLWPVSQLAELPRFSTIRINSIPITDDVFCHPRRFLDS